MRRDVTIMMPILLKDVI